MEDDPGLWVGILTGTTDVFSAGSDLTAHGDYVTTRGGEYGVIRRERRKPLIAAVEGPALGGGLEIVLACDLVVASETARFGLPEVRIGVVPTCAGLFRGPRALPLNVARELVLTGRPIDAARGYQVGLVNTIAEPGGALDAALALAQEICANSPVSVQACLAAINAVQSKDRSGRVGRDRRCNAVPSRHPPMPVKGWPPSWRSGHRGGRAGNRAGCDTGTRVIVRMIACGEHISAERASC